MNREKTSLDEEILKKLNSKTCKFDLGVFKITRKQIKSTTKRRCYKSIELIINTFCSPIFELLHFLAQSSFCFHFWN